MSSEHESWRFAVDRGGTFTDVIGWDGAGRVHCSKLLSEAPERYADAVVEGISRMLQGSADPSVASVRIGTTVATNTLLERRGEPTALVITAGFGDALEIGYQNRPEIFARRIERPAPLYASVLEVDERVGAAGEVVRPLDESSLRAGLERLADDGLRAVAIAFVHGFLYPAHERRAAEIARAIGFDQVSVSHEVSPLRKLVLRGATTVLDAYLSPGLARYVDGLERELSGARLSFMQSGGGLVDAARFAAKDSLLSGPAGGVVGMAEVARRQGLERVVGFDMGGTSTDVSIFDSGYQEVDELEVAGFRLRAPALAIHTVAAGGGSRVRFEAGRLTVGPESEGADPGPASYRRGGELTVTDANLHLGRLQADLFPAVFGPSGDEVLDAAAVEARFDDLARQASADGAPRSPDELAAGVLEIATARMASAIERITVGRGLDVTDFALCSFGGAGGQHACAVAEALGVETILVPPLAGLLSAYGIGCAQRRARREEVVEKRLEAELVARLEARFAKLEKEAAAALGGEEPPARIERSVRLRYEGSDTTLTVSGSEYPGLVERFTEAHRRLFGFVDEGGTIIAEGVVVEAIGARIRDDGPFEGERRFEDDWPFEDGWPFEDAIDGAAGAATLGERPVWFRGERRLTPFRRRAGIAVGEVVPGPAVLTEANATTVVEPGWAAAVDERRNLVLRRSAASDGRRSVDLSRPDPVLLEVFNHRFMEIAEQMGIVLEKTARSVNIKERLDFSCAIFDAVGDLVANAPHMPVHLGSMGESVRAIVRRAPSIAPGDVFALNDPYAGGTHLPDITVVTPLYLDGEPAPQFWVASRGHHADVGGVLPGSMPPESRTIAEEGVVLKDLRIVAGGALQEDAIRAALGSGPWPARNVEQNLADLKAQIAANERGLQGLRSAVSDFGREAVATYMRYVQENAEEAVRRALADLVDGAFRVELDNGQAIEVSIAFHRSARSARVDFTGTSSQRDNNFNAPYAVCRAAVLYVFRTLVERDIPLNAGCLRPLEIVVPPRSMLRPSPPAAVVGGNVETSQCVTDALFGALGVLAAAQGTMNNLTFGDDELQYYETICGGAGAGPDFDGAAAVHTHMTNSRLTDPEVLERRFPVRVEAFAMRRGSGGEGRFRGGDGAVRRLRFLAPLSVSILSNRRRVPPFGLAGGLPGSVGVNRLERGDGGAVDLGPTATVGVEAGDLLVLETPGGGGYGVPE